MEARRASIYIILGCHRSGVPGPALLRRRDTGGPERNRTSSRPLKKRLLYPFELRVRAEGTPPPDLPCQQAKTRLTFRESITRRHERAPWRSFSNRMLPTHSLPRLLSPGATPPPQRATTSRAARKTTHLLDQPAASSQQSTAGQQPTADLQPTSRPTAHGRSPAHERADNRSGPTAYKPPERRRPPGFPEAAFANVVDRRVLSCL